MVTVLVLVAGVTCLPAADKPSGVFFEPLEVPLVSLDVYVFDRDGTPVPGLTADDFEVLEDGEPIEISHFFASGVEEAEQEAEAVPDAVAAETAVPVDPNQALYLVVYVNENNFSRSRRQAALMNLQALFTQELPKDLRVMLVTYRGAVVVKQPLTDDPNLLLAAIEDIQDELSLNYDAQKGVIFRNLQRLAATPGSEMKAVAVDSLLREIETYAAERAHRTRQALDSLQGLLRSMSGLPGRKAVFFVSDGIEMRPGEDLYILFERAFGSIGARMKSRRENLEPAIDDVVELANSYRVSFYTLSTLADAVTAGFSAEFKGIGGSSGLEILPMPDEDAFTEMTSSTGGKALANNSKLAEHLGEVAQELSCYYSLGYRPSAAKVGSYHRIKVKVKRDGVKVRHREGYRVKAVEERMADKTLSAAIHGMVDNPLGIRVEASTGKRQDDGTYTVPVLIKVPLGQLVLMPQQSSHQGKISVYLAVRDLSGDLSDVQHRQYPVDIPNSQLLTAISQEAGFAVGLAMREGEQVVAVGVRDELSNVESLVTIEVVVGGIAQDTNT